MSVLKSLYIFCYFDFFFFALICFSPSLFFPSGLSSFPLHHHLLLFPFSPSFPSPPPPTRHFQSYVGNSHVILCCMIEHHHHPACLSHLFIHVSHHHSLNPYTSSLPYKNLVKKCNFERIKSKFTKSDSP